MHTHGGLTRPFTDNLFQDDLARLGFQDAEAFSRLHFDRVK